MRNIDRVYEALKSQPLTAHEIADLFGFASYSMVVNYITTLMYEKKIDVVGRQRVNGRLRRIYKAKKFAPTLNQLVKMYQRVDRLRNVPFRELPFSDNEEHYGREGKKWCWQEVENEAKMIHYHKDSPKNKLPFRIL